MSASQSAIAVADLQAAIAATIQPLEETEALPLRAARDRVLHADLAAPIDLPGQPNSAMDGWALAAASLAPDGPTMLRQAGIAVAGHPWTGTLGPGECVRIMTGAVVPEGADTVVMQEVVQAEGERIHIPAGQRAGQNVRQPGEDLARGARALPRGTRLHAGHLALAAALGLERLTVTRRPRVAVFSTGDELRNAGDLLLPGTIYDSNRAMLIAAAERAGCESIDLGLVRDEPAQLERALDSVAGRADVLLTSGGVSMGTADTVRNLLEGRGDIRFCQVDLRPGRPFAWGALQGDPPAHLFALPGNPVAAAIGFLLFVRPALLGLQGCREVALPRFPARAMQDFPKKPGRREYLRGVCEPHPGGTGVRLAGEQGSAMLGSLCAADCLIELAEQRATVHGGETVAVIPLAGLL